MTNSSDDFLRQSKEYKNALLLIEERKANEKRLDEIKGLLTGSSAALAVLDTNRKRPSGA
jgi:hypothetical protein